MADELTADDLGKEIPEESEGAEEVKVEVPEVDEGAEAEEGEKEPEIEPEIEEKDIPVRRNVQEHIIARQRKTIEKLRSKEDEEAEEEEDGDEDTQSAVAKEVDKRLSPLLATLATEAEEKELQTLLVTSPEAKRYEKRIRAYMQHAAYRNVAAEVIFHHLAFSEAAKVGSKKKNAADLEAGHSRTAGTPRRRPTKTSQVPTIEELDNMTDAELEAVQNDVLQGKYRVAEE